MKRRAKTAIKPSANQIPDRKLPPIRKRFRSKWSDKTIPDNYRRVLEYVYEYVCEHGFSPSIREINELTGTTSSSSGWRILERLQKNGFLDKIPGKERSLYFTQLGLVTLGKESPETVTSEVLRLREEVSRLKLESRSNPGESDLAQGEYGRLERAAFMLVSWLDSIPGKKTANAEILMESVKSAIGSDRYYDMLKGTQ